MAIIEVFLGAILPVLIEKLASGELLKFLRRAGIDAQVKEWRTTLLMIEAVLTDAENKQTANEAVNLWLKDLEDLAYDLEDLVDELNTEALQRKLRENKGSTSRVKNLIPTCCTNLSYADFMFDRGISSKLKEISGRLEALSEQIKMLSLVEKVKERPSERLPTTSLVVESEVHGREEDKEKIIKILLGVESNGSPISVIPIVGMGGIGKTTLVQLVYNDEILKDKFDLKAWACVSDEFNAVRITKHILEEVSGGKCDSENFNVLQVKLKESLSNKKFLVVLDDIWSENPGDWDILRQPFLAGKPGSKIIITTRKETVAKIMSEIPSYNLKLLSEGDALSLLAQHAFGAKTFDAYPELIEIGKSVVRRCQNLPLAVKALGGLLRGKVGPKDWEEVLKSEIWMDEENSDIQILPALKLSYHYLRPQLKRCFAYCALFPKDYEFDKFKLVYFWMAEGLVQESKKGKSIEDVGGQYFDELLSRSFFQQSSVDASCFVMHDLFNDLAMSVAGEKCLRMDDAPTDVSEKLRHLSFTKHQYETYHRFDFLNKVQKLRTFLPPSVESYSNYYLSQRILRNIIPKLYCLRELSLSGYSINELPDSIGELRHLRYLDLAGTLLMWLPESVSTLINLQVLILRDCWRLTKLPTSMEDLITLRHLDISYTHELREMPQGIAQLTSLRTLTKMTASKNNGLRLKDLGNLSCLQGEISIEELQNVVNVQEAMDARLMDKPSLNKIRLKWLKWREVFDDSRNKIFELDVLNALKPHENLSTLEIMDYGGENFSNWIGNSAFMKLAKICFRFCRNCMTLPPLGQLPLLSDLRIQGMDQVKVIGAEFYGNRGHGEVPFPSLISMAFENMCNWEEWVGIEGVIELPRLRKLKIKSCSKLVRLPNLLLPSLCKLEATECNEVILKHMQNLESLTQIDLRKIFGLTSVIKAFVQLPLTLESLNVEYCDNLVTLWPSDSTAGDLINLRQVNVYSCPQLWSLKEINVLPYLKSLTIRCCGSLKEIDAPPGLKSLTIESCGSLKEIDAPPDLKSLMIRYCGSLKDIDAPPDLRKLEISNCESLKLLPNKISCLEDLCIYKCPSLETTMMKLQDCSTSLKFLSTGSWMNLNLTNLLGSGHSYQSLTKLGIISCDVLESFPNGGLPTPNLRDLYIHDCQHLKSLPDHMELLSSLSWLSVERCASLVELFPQDNIPPNLSYLHISYCEKLKPLGEWGLQKCVSLEDFIFGGCQELVSFTNNADEEYCVLPTSLIELSLHSLPNLEILSKGFQNLTSLKHLYINQCPKLVGLPMNDHLEKLLHLYIKGCPLLEKRCLKDKGDYWHIIANIPEVKIDERFIYDPCP